MYSAQTDPTQEGPPPAAASRPQPFQTRAWHERGRGERRERRDGTGPSKSAIGDQHSHSLEAWGRCFGAREGISRHAHSLCVFPHWDDELHHGSAGFLARAVCERQFRRPACRITQEVGHDNAKSLLHRVEDMANELVACLHPRRRDPAIDATRYRPWAVRNVGRRHHIF